MIALWIGLSVLGVLFLIALLPAGAECRYDGETLIFLRIGFLKLQLIPEKPKNRKRRDKEAAQAEKKKEAKARKKREKKEAALIQKKRKEDKIKQPLPDKIAGLIPFVKLVAELLGTLRRKLLIKKLLLHISLAGSDPAKVGVNTGRAWAVIASAMPILKNRFRIRSSDVQVSPDFVGTKTEIFVVLYLRFLVGDLIALAVKYEIKALKLYFKWKKQQKLKKAVQQ